MFDMQAVRAKAVAIILREPGAHVDPERVWGANGAAEDGLQVLGTKDGVFVWTGQEEPPVMCIPWKEIAAHTPSHTGPLPLQLPL